MSRLILKFLVVIHVANCDDEVPGLSVKQTQYTQSVNPRYKLHNYSFAYRS